MLVSFKGDEEKLIDSVISVLDAGREKFTFQEMNIISELQHKGIIINLERREVIRNGKKVGMTYTEFEILQLLAKNPGRVLSKEQIYDVVWKESYSGDYNIVMSHISHIREKIEDDPVHNTRLFNQKMEVSIFHLQKNCCLGIMVFSASMTEVLVKILSGQSSMI